MASSQRRIKIAENLFKRGDVYYYRKYGLEERLGKFKNDAEAIKAKEIFERLRDRIGSEAFEWRVKHLWPQYIEERRLQLYGRLPGRRQISQETFDEIIGIWERHLRKFFANRKLSEIDAVLWNQYCKQAKVSDLTNHRKVLRGFLGWCEAEGKIRFIPTLSIPEVRRRKRKRIPEEHLRLILENAKGSLLIFIAQYLFMLMRRNEQAQARWEHYNFKEDWVIIPDENTRTRTGRVISLNPYVKELLLKRREEFKRKGIKTPWVFPKRGAPHEHSSDDAIGKRWAALMKRIGLDKYGYEPHDLRATGEHEASKDPRFTDTQREKFAGASMTTQKRIYLQGYMADDVRGLESVVSYAWINEVMKQKLRDTQD